MAIVIDLSEQHGCRSIRFGNWKSRIKNDVDMWILRRDRETEKCISVYFVDFRN